jgi:DNA invertase Pin-like site-specific DNA recombinase
MPNLTEFQKHLIRQRVEEGIIIRAIANELNVNKNTVLLVVIFVPVFLSTDRTSTKITLRHFISLEKMCTSMNATFFSVYQLYHILITMSNGKEAASL